MFGCLRFAAAIASLAEFVPPTAIAAALSCYVVGGGTIGQVIRRAWPPMSVLLVLALLYHDIGKSKDDDHHIESARQARLMFERLHLDRDASETIDFLVTHHLDMSVAAFRRDTEDPEIVRQLADLVGIEERLKMLCLLTLVDVEAVSPDTLTPWREELLWRLYVDTYNHLTLEYSRVLAPVIGALADRALAGG